MSGFLLAPAGLALSALLAAASPAASQDRAVTIVLGEEAETLDPCSMARSTVGRIVRQNISETLTEINPKDGSVTPRLATSWEAVDDRTWRFQLREGVTFHDGTPFTSEAVVATIDRTFNSPDLFCENKSKAGVSKIKATAIDEYTVDIALEQPAPILPVRMGIIGITPPDASTTDMILHPVGTGPYKLDRWNPGEEVILVRSEEYWGPKPEIERARYVHRGESAVRAAMVELGEADLAPNISEQDATNPEMDYSYLNSETTRLRLDVMTPPLNDKRVREALNYALDREAMRGSVFSKDVLHSTQLIVPSIAGHNHEIDKELRPYDPEKAMALIAEAKADGVPVDRELVLICRINQWPGATEAMETVMAYFHQVGLNVKLRCLEVGEHSALQNKPFSPDRGAILFQDQHDNNNGDPVFTAFTKYGCEGTQSTACNEETDALMAKATALPIGEERVKTWEQVFRNIYEDAVDVTLFHMVGYTRVGKRISYQPSIATNSEVQLRDITFK